MTEPMWMLAIARKRRPLTCRDRLTEPGCYTGLSNQELGGKAGMRAH